MTSNEGARPMGGLPTSSGSILGASKAMGCLQECLQTARVVGDKVRPHYILHDSFTQEYVLDLLPHAHDYEMLRMARPPRNPEFDVDSGALCGTQGLREERGKLAN